MNATETDRMTSLPAAPPAAVTHSTAQLQELQPPRTLRSVVQHTIDRTVRACVGCQVEECDLLGSRPPQLMRSGRGFSEASYTVSCPAHTLVCPQTPIWFTFCPPSDFHLCFRSRDKSNERGSPDNQKSFYSEAQRMCVKFIRVYLVTWGSESMLKEDLKPLCLVNEIIS